MNVSGKLDKMNDDLIQKITNTDEPVIRYKGKKINAKWNWEYIHYDVREYLKDVACPVLAITGTKDVQVRPEHTQVICSIVQGSCESYLIENMTHILRKTDAEMEFSVLLKDYKNQVKQPIDKELKEKMVEWLSRQFG